MKHPEIRAFLATHYSDEKLAALLAHAEDGKLAFYSCCCLVGTATSNHALRGHSAILDAIAWLPCGVPPFMFPQHYRDAKELNGAEAAENAFMMLGESDEERRAALMPLIEKEMKRRERVRNGQERVRAGTRRELTSTTAS